MIFTSFPGYCCVDGLSSVSPVLHPPVGRPRPPPQSFAPQQTSPSPSPVGYNPYRVEQHPGVYVWEYNVRRVERCVCAVIRTAI